MSGPDFTFLDDRTKNLGVCINHPEVQAVVICRQCKKHMCSVCDFEFPGYLHLCPSCVTQTQASSMSESRKQLLGFSFLAAIATTVFIGVLVSGVAVELMLHPIGSRVAEFVIVASLLTGLGLSIASIDNRAGNSPFCWVSLVWNVILTLVWILLTIIGLMAMQQNAI